MPKIKMMAKTVGQRTPPLPSRQVDYWDEDTPGFALRVSPGGQKTWIVMYRVKGETRKRRMKLGTYPSLSLGDARDAAKDAQRAASKGIDTAALEKREKAAETFSELADAYIERYAKRNKKSWKEDERIIDRDLRPALGLRKARGVTRADVNAILEKLVGRGAPIQANRVFAVLRKMFKWAISQDIVEVSPCYGISNPTKERSRERVLSEGEIKALWEATDLEGRTKTGKKLLTTAKRTRLALRLILVTAQRPGEVAGAAWTEFDPDWEESESPFWTIPSERTKNGRTHRVPLSPLAVSLLKEARKLASKSKWVFPSPRDAAKAVSGGSLSHALGKAGHFKVAHFTPHDLRRTAGTNITGEQCGISRFVLERVLNHTDPSVTAVYDRYAYDREKRQALNAWAQVLEALTAGKAPRSNVVSYSEARGNG